MKPLQLLCMFLIVAFGGITAQDFKDKIAQTKRSIDSIVTAEKAQLKERLRTIEYRLDRKEITEIESRDLKREASKEAAEAIRIKTREQSEKLSALLHQRIAEKHLSDSITYKKEMQKVIDSVDIESRPTKTERTEVYVDRNYVHIDHNGIYIGQVPYREEDYYESDYKRTQGGGYFALAFHNLNSSEHFSNNHFRLWGSKSVEIGYIRNTRLLKNNNLLHLNYGLSWMMDKLKMKEDEHFVKNGNITEIVPYPKETIKSKFKTMYLILPISLEFDFTEPIQYKGKTYYPAQMGFHAGVGAYVGALLATKQKVKYTENGSTHKDMNRKYYNVNEWTYGVSANIGYGWFSFYARYSLVPLFTNNPINEYPFSVGIRLGH
ncbi:hypothetical protein [Capnocytophaga leadbetteri]|uniref:hypothetical protein n=1 Tax=Capnocytophaga leadbetteri TaxID=327575 RepID=UPI003C743259